MAGLGCNILTDTFAAFWVEYNFKIVAALIEQSDFGQGMGSLLTSSFKAFGKSFAAQEFVSPEASMSDVTLALTQATRFCQVAAA